MFGQRENLRFILHPAKWRRENNPVVIALKLCAVFVCYGA
jgi:hypothetical protein